MEFYHCSPTAGLTLLQPKKPFFSEKPAMVYMTTLTPMALLYGIHNYEYSYGYTPEGQIYFDEYFPHALEILYRGKRASLYRCAPNKTASTRIPNEAVSEEAVPVLEEQLIPDVCEALLEQEKQGALVIHPYDTLSPQMKDWIRREETATILEHRLLHTPGPMADYFRTHYPESWAIAAAEQLGSKI